MDDSWRTSDVLAIIAGMRQTQDYSALPILADAMQDAEYPDEGVLTQFRSGVDDITACRLLCLVMGGEYAESVKWMDEFVKEFEVGYGELAEAIKETPSWPDTYDPEKSSRFADKQDDFWKHWQVVTGQEKVNVWYDPFECSC